MTWASHLGVIRFPWQGFSKFFFRFYIFRFKFSVFDFPDFPDPIFPSSVHKTSMNDWFKAGLTDRTWHGRESQVKLRPFPSLVFLGTLKTLSPLFSLPNYPLPNPNRIVCFSRNLDFSAFQQPKERCPQRWSKCRYVKWENAPFWAVVKMSNSQSIFSPSIKKH